jgi:hypothetical protein
VRGFAFTDAEILNKMGVGGTGGEDAKEGGES